MDLEIRPDDSRSLAGYAAVSCAFEARGGLSAPLRKDYDAIPGNHPSEWAAQFDVERAHFIAAYAEGRRVGGAVVVTDADDVARLGGLSELAVLWDIRVAPEMRGQGIGGALLEAAGAGAKRAGLRGISAETQDINVAACLLYANAGYALMTADADAYPELPDETRMVWVKHFEA